MPIAAGRYIKRSGGLVSLGGTSAYEPPVVEPWSRPVDWLSLPTLAPTDQRFVGLVAVFDDDSNHVALQCAGAYTVDWGDGTVENVAANTTALHTYSYAAIGAGTLSARGYRQAIVSITPQAGQNLTKVDLEQWPAAHGGSARNSLWLDCTAAGPNLTTIQVSTGNYVYHAYLEAFRTVGAAVFSGSFQYCNALQHVDVNIGTRTSLQGMFHNCRGLKVAPDFDWTYVTTATQMFGYCQSLIRADIPNAPALQNLSNMFEQCYALQHVTFAGLPAATTLSYLCYISTGLRHLELPDLPLVTTANSMLQSCTALTEFTLPDTPLLTSLQAMFQDCTALEKVVLTNIPSVTSMANTFRMCKSMTSVTIPDTGAVTNFEQAFIYCSALVEAPELDTANATTMYAMFQDCTALETVPAYDMSKVTTTFFMFYGCRKLTSVPDLTTPLLTTTQYMFTACSSLRQAPMMDMDLVANVSNMFDGCVQLRSVPAYDMSGATSLSAFLNGCYSLAKMLATGIKESFALNQCQSLSAAELNRIYANLATVSGKTITVGTIPAAAGDDPTIATAKGWTVA